MSTILFTIRKYRLIDYSISFFTCTLAVGCVLIFIETVARVMGVTQ